MNDKAKPHAALSGGRKEADSRPEPSPGAAAARETGRARSRELRAMAAVALMETAGLFPAALLYAVYALHASPPILLLGIGLLHLGGQAAGARQIGSGRALPAALALLLAAAAITVAAYGLRPAALAGGAALLAAALRGLLIGRQRGWARLLPQVPAVGVAAAALMYAAIAASKPAGLTPYAPLLYGAGMTALFLLLLRWNRYRIRAAALNVEGEAAPAGRIETVNRRMTGLLLLLVAASAGWQGLGPLLRRVARWLIGLLPKPAAPVPEEKPAEVLPQAMPGFTKGEDAAAGTPEWLRIAGYILLGLLATAAAVALLVLLYRLVRRWLPERVRYGLRRLGRLLRRLREGRRAPEAEGGYIDEVEKIERAAAPARRLWLRLGISARSADEDPRAAYRRLLRGAVKRGFGYRPSRTPLENGADIASPEKRFTELEDREVRRIIDRYNEVRYGGERPD
ncbi:DUF4129 domain-containing protein [Paenibacillus glufosinatiresistens]|uniref:DUF4129 domain-containing protein n=1 Tax=Paenibacillus glufosinatiresistens TaxID=3070657 RepID=UPI00286E4531|nr:DUF4129 domain-containing protein [Paenibacillus sp. YX.27]